MLRLRGHVAAIFQGGRNLCVFFFSDGTGPGQRFTGPRVQHQQAAAVLRGWGTCEGQRARLKTPDPNFAPGPRLSRLAAPRARVQGGQGIAESTRAAGCCLFAAPLAPGGIFDPVGLWHGGEAGRSCIRRKARLPWEGRRDGRMDRGGDRSFSSLPSSTGESHKMLAGVFTLGFAPLLGGWNHTPLPGSALTAAPVGKQLVPLA